MGNVVDLARYSHARTSITSEAKGRTTSEGQGKSSGQLVANQPITSSYLRAVKVVEPPSTRSKKRQSPAAKRPKVAKLTERASEYAEAQAMRLERSSDSMVGDDSRKIPTMQALSVGKFRLAENSDSSDKSAMPTVEEVRTRLNHVFERSGDSPITLAIDWGFGRDHIRDFLEARKDSLKYEVVEMLAEKYDISLDLLIIRRPRRKRKAA